jgi:hypothetical protein
MEEKNQALSFRSIFVSLESLAMLLLINML